MPSPSTPPARRRPVHIALVAALLSACAGGGGDAISPPPTPPPALVARVAFAQVADTAVQGDTTPALAVTAYDAAGRVLTGRATTFASSTPAVATVDAQGRVAALAGGTATITATVEGQSATAAVRVLGIGSVALYPSSAALQPGATGVLWALARDSSGARVAVTHAAFASSNPTVLTVDPGTGAVTAASVGTANVTATLNGRTTMPTAFTVTAPGATVFPISVRFLGTFDPAVQAAARRAADRWQRVVRTNAGTYHVAMPKAMCSPAMPADTTDEAALTIFVVGDTLPGAIIARTSCGIARDGSGGYTFGAPALFLVSVDTAKLKARNFAGSASTPGSAAEVLFAHEFGHVMGVGLLWLPGLTPQPLVVTDATNPRYVGTAGVAAAAALGFVGPSLPVQATGGFGTAGAHWRSPGLGMELMTPYIEANAPLTTITIGAVADGGLSVDYSAADLIPAAVLDASLGPLSPTAKNPASTTGAPSADRRAAAPARIPLAEIVEGPRFVVSRTGRV